MVSTGNGKCTNEIQEELGQATAPSVSQRELLDDRRHQNKFLDGIKGLPGRAGYVKFGSSSRPSSPSSKFWRLKDERDEISRPVPSTADQGFRKRFLVPFVKKINWTSLWAMSKQWIRNPMNMALFVWITCVAISGAILFLVLTGMLNGALPRKSQRNTWFEINNQILNALFTLMCLYQHPKRIYHLVLLCRWKPNDVIKLRNVYCKNGTYKPNEWKHMMVVVVLLHLNCLAQYALCGLNLGYPRYKRPAIGVGLCVSLAFGAPAVASVYNILSPLGKDYEIETDQEAQGQEKRYSFLSREDNRIAVSTPEWVGGLFDVWDDISLAYLSVFCSCCIFGWNMDRLGFGNMYVHITTFLLFCLAPFFIFNLAAINIDNEAVREILGITGFVLCIFGLLYGGFWRIQMRKRFNLPGNTFCCGKPAVTDCFQWLCCWACSLAQEVRTADYYDVWDDKLYMKRQMSDDPTHLVLSPLPREDGPSLAQGDFNSPIARMQNSRSPSGGQGMNTWGKHLPMLDENSSLGGKNETMEPPVTHSIQRDDN